jgi:hypothetical protein
MVVAARACGSTAVEGVEAACFNRCGSMHVDEAREVFMSRCRVTEVEHTGKAGRSPSSSAGRVVQLRGGDGAHAMRCRHAGVESFGGVCLTRYKAARAASRRSLPPPPT